MNWQCIGINIKIESSKDYEGLSLNIEVILIKNTAQLKIWTFNEAHISYVLLTPYSTILYKSYW